MIQCFKAHRPQAIPLNPVFAATSVIQESLHAGLTIFLQKAGRWSNIQLGHGLVFQQL
jgi:hypothetical protein